MDATALSTLVSLLVALSVASERLVEIIKGIFPSLDKENTDPKKEGWRKATLQGLAVIAGIMTALLARPAIEGIVSANWSSSTGIIALGFLASGGSGFWNAIQTYVKNAKDLKKLDAQQRKKTT